MTRKKVHAEMVRTIAVAAIGFALLMVALPEWARQGVLLFAGLYAVLVVVVDDDVRALFVRKARAKSPVSRRAAT